MRAALIICLWLMFPGSTFAQNDPLQDAHNRTIEAFQSGDMAAAVTAAEAALALANRLPDPNRDSVLWAYNNLSLALTTAGQQPERAQNLLEHALELADDFGLSASQPGLTARANLSALLAQAGALDKGKQLIEDGMSLARDGPFQADFAGARAEFYLSHGPYSDAAVALSELLIVNPDLIRNTYGDLFVRLSRLGDAAEADGQWAEVLPLIEVKIRILETLFPDGLDRESGIKTLYFQRYFANNELGRYRLANEHLRVWLSASADFDEMDFMFVQSQISTLSQLGDWDGIPDESGINLLRQLPMLMQIDRTTATAQTGRALLVLADGERSFGQFQQADRAAALARELLGDEAPKERQTARALERRAQDAIDAGNPQAAITLFGRADIARANRIAAPQTPEERATTLYRRAQFLVDSDTPESALPMLDELAALVRDHAVNMSSSSWPIFRAGGEKMRVDVLFFADQPVSPTALIKALGQLVAVGHDNRADFASVLGDGAVRVLFLTDEPTARPFLQAASAAFDEIETFTPGLLATRQQFSTFTLLTGNTALIRKELSAVTNSLKSPAFRHILPTFAGVFEQLAWVLLDTPNPPARDDINTALDALQWTQINRSAEAVQFLETRLSVEDPVRSGLLRERQVLEEQAAQAAQILTGNDPDDQVAYQDIRNDLSRVDASLNALGVDMLGVSAVRPVSLSDIQTMLVPGEMVVTFVLPSLKPDIIPGLNGSSNHVLGITHDQVHIARMGEISRTKLQERVQAFRCQVAVNETGCQKSASRGLRGLFSVSLDAPEKQADQTFDFVAAHALYRDLFGGLDMVMSSQTHLIIAPPADLLRLPFQALVTTATRPDRLADTDWLIKRHAVSVLPSLNALRGLRGGPQAERQLNHMIGFGDPLVGANLPAMNCETIQTIALRAAPAIGPHITQQQDGAVMLADVDHLRGFSRLLDTVCELQAIRAVLDGSADILLGDAATESHVKSLDRQGLLETADVLVFATHGLTAGEAGAAAPGLLLTPPPKATLTDDGLLSAPEIAMLTLNADLVVLSACNTAAGGRADQDGLSGLARSFFQAGARALFVTHWSVFSEASVDVSTGMFAALKDDPNLLYAAALQRSVLAILNDPTRSALQHHPAYWGAFFIVGAT